MPMMILEQTAKANYNHSYSVPVPVLVAVTFAKEEARRHPFSNKYDKRHGPACKVKTCITMERAPKKWKGKCADYHQCGGWASRCSPRTASMIPAGRPSFFPFPPDLGSTNIHPSTRKSFFVIQKNHSFNTPNPHHDTVPV